MASSLRTVDRALRRAKQNRASHAAIGGVAYYSGIGKKTATDIVREAFGPTATPPRRGRQVVIEGTHDGYPGRWLLTNRGGTYELQFVGSATYY